MKYLKANLLSLATFLGFSAVAIFILGCSDSTSPETGQGQIKITMVDSPAEYDQVNIVVTRVEVHKAGADSTSGWFIINDDTATYDLLTLRNGASVVLGDTSLDAGRYTQIRLIIGTGSNIVVDGVTYPLEVPSGAQTGVKLNHSFNIGEGQLYELLLDFDAERSIILTGSGQYKLQPVIRLVPLLISGTISGIISPATVKTIVWTINGTDTISTVSDTTSGFFKLMALLTGNYDITFWPAPYTNYKDTTITNVSVTAQQNTDLDTIILSVK